MQLLKKFEVGSDNNHIICCTDLMYHIGYIVFHLNSYIVFHHLYTTFVSFILTISC